MESFRRTESCREIDRKSLRRAKSLRDHSSYLSVSGYPVPPRSGDHSCFVRNGAVGNYLRAALVVTGLLQVPGDAGREVAAVPKALVPAGGVEDRERPGLPGREHAGGQVRRVIRSRQEVTVDREPSVREDQAGSLAPEVPFRVEGAGAVDPGAPGARGGGAEFER